MRGPLPVALAMVLLAGVFAGCTDGGKDPRLVELPGEEGDGSAARGGRGALMGSVLDAAFNPVANATVRLDPGGRATAADPDGGYRFDDVAAGRYRASFAAPGFVDAARVVVVQPSNATRLVVHLVDAPRTTPHHATRPFAGFTECSVAAPPLPAPVVGGGVAATCVPVVLPQALRPPTNDRHVFLFEAGANLSSAVVEVEWDAGLNALASRFLVLLEQAGSSGTGGLLYASATGSSPLRVELGEEDVRRHTLQAGGALQVRVFVAAEAAPGLAVQQPFRVAASLFYFAPHEPGFSGLA